MTTAAAVPALLPSSSVARTAPPRPVVASFAQEDVLEACQTRLPSHAFRVSYVSHPYVYVRRLGDRDTECSICIRYDVDPRAHPHDTPRPFLPSVMRGRGIASFTSLESMVGLIAGE